MTEFFNSTAHFFRPHDAQAPAGRLTPSVDEALADKVIAQRDANLSAAVTTAPPGLALPRGKPLPSKPSKVASKAEPSNF